MKIDEAVDILEAAATKAAYFGSAVAGQTMDVTAAQQESRELSRAIRAILRERNERVNGNDTSALQIALDESVKLQSHYAGLLNAYDGGERIKFDTSNEWIARLRQIGRITV